MVDAASSATLTNLGGATKSELISGGYFGGSPSGILTSFNPSGYSSFTVTAWVNLNGVAPASDYRVVANSHSDIDNNGFQLIVTGISAFPRIQMGNGTAFANVTSSSGISLTRWQHMAAVLSGGVLTLYVDGVPAGTAAMTGPVTAGTANIGIGYNPAYNGDYFVGFIARVSVYPAALSSADVLNLFTGNIPVTSSVPVARWLLNDSSGSSIAADSSGSGHSGMVTSVIFTGTAVSRPGARRVNTLTVAGSTYTPNSDTTDIAIISSPGADFTIASPAGTPLDGDSLVIRIRSGATPHVPTWGSIYSGSTALPLPASCTASKMDALTFQYSATAVKWELLAYAPGNN